MVNSGGKESPLVTWKEIAGYLGVSVRTAQDWHRKEGLPVHRVSDSEKGVVLALSGELDEWISERRRLRPLRTTFPKVPVFLPGLLGCALLLFGSVFLLKPEREPTFCKVEGQSLIAFGEDGEPIWVKRVASVDDGTVDDRISAGWCSVWDSDGDNEAEVILVNVARDPRRKPGGVVQYSSLGEREWSFSLDGILPMGDFAFAPFQPSIVGQLQGTQTQTHPYLLVIAVHQGRYPSQTFLLDPSSGESLSGYPHPGYFYDFQEVVTSTGERALALGGVNNPGDGTGHPVMCLLRIPFEKAGKHVGFFGETASREISYWVFPRVDIWEKSNEIAVVGSLSLPTPDVLVAEVRGKRGLIQYYFDLPDFALRQVFISDFLRSEHQVAEKSGVVSHRLEAEEEARWSTVLRFASAPDGNDIEIESLFLGAPPCHEAEDFPCVMTAGGQVNVAMLLGNNVSGLEP